MNKYLAKRCELEKEFKDEFPESAYAVFRKLEIASELNDLITLQDYELDLTDEQQEKLINIIFNFYMDSDIDASIYKCVKAVLSVVVSKTYDKFIEEYKKDCYAVEELFDSNLD